jgi:hypothetical protein
MSSTDSSANPKENKGDTTNLGGWFTGKTQGVNIIEAAYSRAGATSKPSTELNLLFPAGS